MNARLQLRLDWPDPGMTRLAELMRRLLAQLRARFSARRGRDTSIAWEDGEREEDRRS